MGRAGYTSAMVGKWHMGGPENNEAEKTTPIEAGFDYYYGNVHGFLRIDRHHRRGYGGQRHLQLRLRSKLWRVIPLTALTPVPATLSESEIALLSAYRAVLRSRDAPAWNKGAYSTPARRAASAPPPSFTRLSRLENAYYVGELEKMSKPEQVRCADRD